MTSDEITALALVLHQMTPAHQISSMELRTILEWLRGRGYLVQPQPPIRCATCHTSTPKETT